MAEFALALTKVAVEGTVSRVKAAIEEEAKLKVTVQHDLVFITGELQMMQSFLNVANKERAQNQVVRTWVRQLRELAFDVEDSVEFVVHLDKKKKTWWWRLVPSCMAPPLPLDEAVAEIKLLKVRVEEVSQRNSRYNLISDSGSKPASSLVKGVQPATPTSFNDVAEAWRAAGKWRGTDNLQNLITCTDDNLRVISVWGSTGGDDVQTSSILWKAYSDQGVCQEFERRAWVKLVHPFNPDDFFKSLLTQFCRSSSQDANRSEVLLQTRIRALLAMEDDLMRETELMKLLREQRYLVFLQDVSAMVQWDVISSCLPNSNNGSRIIVSTKQFDIAVLCAGDPYQVVELRRCSDGQSVFAFFNKEFTYHGYGGCDPSCCRSRVEKAREWTQKIQPIASLEELFGINTLIKQHGVISVWGIAGLGKSTLVRSVYYNSVIRSQEKFAWSWEYFINGFLNESFKKYSWVDVPNPFSLMEFARRLFLDFHSDDNQSKETAAICIAEGQDPIQGCRKLLDDGKCFIVIDDLRSTEDWDMIKAAFLPHLSRDSTMVVITSEPNVSRRCVNEESNMINIKGLDADLAFRVFEKEVWGDDWVLTDEEKDLSKQTVAKCGGLPSIILAIGKYCYQPRSWLEEKYEAQKANMEENARRQTKCLVEDINNDFIRKLETDPEFHCLHGLFYWVRSNSDACSDSVKPCIFYLSVFPAGTNIRRRRLLRRWIAEGYSRDTHGRTAEENGAILFYELVKLGIIQHAESKLMCQVNTFVREYIISRPIMEDNLVFVLEGCCSPNTLPAGQHLTIRSCWDRDINVFMSIDFSRLRSLTVFGEWRPFFISSNIRMRVLRVLDLEGNMGVTYHDLEKIGKLLTRLKFLSLRGCRQIKQLPSSFVCLRQLQTLDVRHTSIVMLPPAIFQLEKLQYVRAGMSKWHAGDDIATIVKLPEVHGDQASPPQEDDDMPTVVPQPAVHGDQASPAQEDDDTATILPLPAVHGDQASPPQEEGDGSKQGEADPPLAAQKNKTSTCSWSWVSWFRKLRSLSSCDWKPAAEIDSDGDDSDGVDVPAAAEIGNLTALHTLGVINVNGAGGKAFLKELNKLTQLRKLGVCSINKGNIRDLFSAISGHRHLESLSLQVEDNCLEEFHCLDDLSLEHPPKTLKSLKLCGNLKKFPVWIEQLGNLNKIKLELTVPGQEGIDALCGFPHIDKILSRLCVRLSQGGKLHFGMPEGDTFRFGWENGVSFTSRYFKITVLEIDCPSSSEISLGSSMMSFVELLKVRCSGQACLKISGLEGLSSLKEVWLMGSFDDTLKQMVQQQLGKNQMTKPVLKLVQPSSCF